MDQEDVKWLEAEHVRRSPRALGHFQNRTWVRPFRQAHAPRGPPHSETERRHVVLVR
jgi:hypothetical protein